MPNRVIKESIWTSPNLNKLSAEAERHFYRIMLLADDHGCFESSPQVIKGKCYPLLEGVSSRDVELWNKELDTSNLTLSWKKNNRQYSILVKFQSHQTIRSLHNRKTPPPPESIIEQLATIVNTPGLTPYSLQAKRPKTMKEWDEELARQKAHQGAVSMMTSEEREADAKRLGDQWDKDPAGDSAFDENGNPLSNED